MLGIALPASGGPVAGGTATNPIRTDPTGTTTQPVSGTVTANAGTGTLAVSGPLTDAQLRATAVPVSGTVTANAGSGTFTCDTELPVAAALADATANPSVPSVGGLLLGFNGTTWDRLQVDASKFLKITIAAALPAGTAEIGNVKNTGTFVVQATLAAETTKVIGTVNVAAGQTIAVTNAGTFATQSVCTNAGTFAVQIDAGAVTSLALIDDVIFTDDAAFTPATSKVAAIGFQADETATDSVDEGDIGCPRMTLDRKIHVVNEVESNSMRAAGTSLTPKFAFANVAASTTDGNIVTAVASKKIRVLAVVFVAGATATNVTFNSKPAGAGTAKSALFAAAANGGAALPYNPVGWFETVSGEGLTATTGTGATVGIQVVYVEV